MEDEGCVWVRKGEGGGEAGVLRGGKGMGYARKDENMIDASVNLRFHLG